MAKRKNYPVPAIIAIEKNIPIPVFGVFGRWEGMFEKMEPGDSFALPLSSGVRQNNLITQARRYVTSKGLGWKFVTRTVEEDGVKKIRIWRLR